jgi:EAL domain-containing protein (putative c-di-GMP-specific phosphodiesterase class I)
LEETIGILIYSLRSWPDQFKLFYQSQFSSRGQLRGLEALIRLDDPIFGLVNPDSFIAVAERTDFILPLGAWVSGEPSPTQSIGRWA